LLQVARVLTRAHALGLVHRDLKPANIFLAREDDQEIVKVLDFGVAKTTALGADLHGETASGTILGTPSYMSPEQARGDKDVDARADVWALGVIAFRCLTGKLPFRGDGLGTLFVQIIMEARVVPSSIAPVPPGFDAFWARASDRDIDRRFQTVKEFLQGLAIAFDTSIGRLSLSSVVSGVSLKETSKPPAPALGSMTPPPVVRLGADLVDVGVDVGVHVGADVGGDVGGRPSSPDAEPATQLVGPGELVAKALAASTAGRARRRARIGVPVGIAVAGVATLAVLYGGSGARAPVSTGSPAAISVSTGSAAPGPPPRASGAPEPPPSEAGDHDAMGERRLDQDPSEAAPSASTDPPPSPGRHGEAAKSNPVGRPKPHGATPAAVTASPAADPPHERNLGF